MGAGFARSATGEHTCGYPHGMKRRGTAAPRTRPNCGCLGWCDRHKLFAGGPPETQQQAKDGLKAKYGSIAKAIKAICAKVDM